MHGTSGPTGRCFPLNTTVTSDRATPVRCSCSSWCVWQSPTGGVHPRPRLFPGPYNDSPIHSSHENLNRGGAGGTNLEFPVQRHGVKGERSVPVQTRTGVVIAPTPGSDSAPTGLREGPGCSAEGQRVQIQSLDLPGTVRAEVEVCRPRETPPQ